MGLLELLLGLVLGTLIVFYVLRIVLTWYPQIPLQKFPWVIVYVPTEPLLVLLRRLVPPLGGVDITPVLGVGLFSLLRELLLGQQGILTMLDRLSS
ncbi:MAG: YggT family protein [Pseudanabaenaceae cyanobacterium SKYGB_i_bin29]|nr:YggT family protein [Pseudanabaenaceae cyanobacterium SKYG29]MDW8421523.1 YggT family protein [Pseudanabaenaceae cyanobacterium SKYGB_i_bin29]